MRKEGWEKVIEFGSVDMLYSGKKIMIDLDIMKKFGKTHAIVLWWLKMWSDNDYIPVNNKRLSEYLWISKRQIISILKDFRELWFIKIKWYNELGEVCYQFNQDLFSKIKQYD